MLSLSDVDSNSKNDNETLSIDESNKETDESQNSDLIQRV